MGEGKEGGESGGVWGLEAIVQSFRGMKIGIR
jgi:hypothetical protein